jgi:hypothetical protein
VNRLFVLHLVSIQDDIIGVGRCIVFSVSCTSVSLRILEFKQIYMSVKCVVPGIVTL